MRNILRNRKALDSRNNSNHPCRFSTTRRSRKLLRNQRHKHTRARRKPAAHKPTHLGLTLTEQRRRRNNGHQHRRTRRRN